MAPAPTEVKRDQRADHRAQQHRQAPVARLGGVAPAGAAGSRSAAWRLARTPALYSVAAAVSSRATPSVVVMRCCTAALAGPTRCSSHSASQRGRNAARAQQAHHAPGHQALARQAHGAAQLGEGGKQQVGADGQVGLDAKEEDQDGRHQRAAAHTGQAHDHADGKARKDKRKIMHGRECRFRPCRPSPCPIAKGWNWRWRRSTRPAACGRKLEVIARDDGGKPEDAVRHAVELTSSREGGDVLAGGFLSNIGLAWPTCGLQNKRAVRRLRAPDRRDRLGQGQPLHLPAAPSTYMQAAMLAEEAAKLPARRWATVAPNYEYGHSRGGELQGTAQGQAPRCRVRRRAVAGAGQDRRRRT
jgi:hypothetical protein